MNFEDFPVVVHLITVPLTIAGGFILGWIARGALGQPPRRPLPPTTDRRDA